MNDTVTTADSPAATAPDAAAPGGDEALQPAPDSRPQGDGAEVGDPAHPAQAQRRSRGGRRSRGKGTGGQPAAERSRDPSAGPGEADAAERPAEPAAQQQQRARQPRKPNAVLERLFQLHPKMFGARFLPLKLGAFQDILALHPDEFKREDLKIALGLHARSTRYLEAVASGHQRHDLHGEPVEPVAPEHVHHAILEVFRRRQARTQDDLRPQLKARLIDAIEASALSREDYTMMAARMQDDVANAVLDEAFAEIGIRTAKREALRSAFESSGKSVEEFAEMYGMAPKEVRRALGER